MAEERRRLEAAQKRIYGLLVEPSDDESEVNDSASENEENDVPQNEPDHNSESEQSDSEEEQDISHNLEECREYYLGKDKITKWRKFPLSQNTRTRNQNIVTHLPGPKNNAKNLKTPIECFNVLIDNDIIRQITMCTNIYIYI